MMFRPRFSIRTLVVLVTLLCCYAACWQPTKTQGVRDVMPVVGREAYGFDADWDAEPVASVFWSSFVDASASMPQVVGATPVGSDRRSYYFWCFGYVAKLPYEREVETAATAWESFEALPAPAFAPHSTSSD